MSIESIKQRIVEQQKMSALENVASLMELHQITVIDITSYIKDRKTTLQHLIEHRTKAVTREKRVAAAEKARTARINKNKALLGQVKTNG